MEGNFYLMCWLSVWFDVGSVGSTVVAFASTAASTIALIASTGVVVTTAVVIATS